MADRAQGAPAQQWPLRGFWLAWFWVSVLVCVVLIVAASWLMILAWWGSGPARLVPLGAGVILFVISGIIGWQLSHTATIVTVAADGALILRRPRGALHTHARRVQRVRPSVLRSDPYTPTVIKTADGWALLIHTRDDVDDLVTALRHHNPDFAVEI